MEALFMYNGLYKMVNQVTKKIISLISDIIQQSDYDPILFNDCF